LKKVSTAQRQRRSTWRVAQLKNEIARLQQELAQVREEVVNNNESNKYLRGEFMRVVNENRGLQLRLDVEREKHRASEVELQQRLTHLQIDYDDLDKISKRNFDKMQRNGDVATVMAYMLAATDASVAEVMHLFSEVARQVEIPVNIADARDAFRRGYMSRVDQVVLNSEAIPDVPDII